MKIRGLFLVVQEGDTPLPTTGIATAHNAQQNTQYSTTDTQGLLWCTIAV